MKDLTPVFSDPGFFILTIRYDDSHANRITCRESVNYGFREDKRIPKAIRTNPVMLRLFIMAMLQHSGLQVGKGNIEIEGKSHTTVYYRRKACMQCATSGSGWQKNSECRLPRRGTPLLIAAQNGHTEVVKLLLACSADTNARWYTRKLERLKFLRPFFFITPCRAAFFMAILKLPN